MKARILSIAVLSASLSACGGGSGSESNSAPIISKAQIVSQVRGDDIFNRDTLEIEYGYQDVDGDAEGNTKFRWLVDGEEKGTQPTYQVTREDVEKDIRVEITPVAVSGELIGQPVTSNRVKAKLRQFNVFTAQIDGVKRATMVTDGTTEGTFELGDIYTAPNREDVSEELLHQGKVYMQIRSDNNDVTMAVTDGTKEGTTVFDNGNFDTFLPKNMAAYDGFVFFQARSDGDYELWKTDGTMDGTSLVEDINPQYSSYPEHLTVHNDRLFFSAFGADRQLYRTKKKGTISEGYGIDLFTEFPAPGPNLSVSFKEVVSYKDKLVFATGGPVYASGEEDFDANPTVLSNEATNASQFIDTFFGNLFFASNNKSVWMTDGTPENTQVVLENSESTSVTSVLKMVNHDDLLYMSVRTASDTTVLYSVKTDGTELKALDETESDQILDVVSIRDTLYVAANKDPSVGAELYRLDDDKLTLIKDINDGEGNGIVGNGRLRSLNNKLIFVADDNSVGQELWITNGTEEGTQLLKDIYPGESGSSIIELDL